MTAAGKQRQARPRRRFILGLGQDAAAGGDHRISGQHDGAGMAAGDQRRLLTRQAFGMGARLLTGLHSFVQIGRIDRIGHQPQPGQQIEPARAGRSENQPHGRAQSSGAMVTVMPSSAGVKAIWQESRLAGVR